MDELLSSDATMSGAWLVTFVARITISKSHQPRSFQRCRHLEIPPPASPLDKQPFCASNPRFPGFQPKVAETRFRKLGEGVRQLSELVDCGTKGVSLATQGFSLGFIPLGRGMISAVAWARRGVAKTSPNTQCPIGIDDDNDDDEGCV